MNNLPNSLNELDCSYNQINQLDHLPNSLKEVDCSNNKIINLNNLPNSLKQLNCDDNQIIQLDNLPNSLEELTCSFNQIKQLDNLPNSLKILYCDNFDINYWKEKTFERKFKAFIENRSAKIIQRSWTTYWYKPYKYEEIDGKLIGIPRSQERYFNQFREYIN